MKLLSDTLPGNGEGLAGIIDNDVCFDAFGLPYIPARRIKGILREVAQQLNCFATYTGITDEFMARIFQDSGSSEEAKFSLGNGYLKDHSDLTAYLQYAQNHNDLSKRFPPQSVLSLYTYTRSQTSLENGTAKENTLRQSRVLKKGLEFVFDCRIEEDLLPKLQVVIRLAKSMGLNRTRGLGEIQLTFPEPPVKIRTATHTPAVLNDNDTAILRLRILNKCPLLLSSESGKTQESLTHIPGSVILGACASQYIKAKKNSNPNYDPDKDTEFLNLFVDGAVSWGNGNLWANKQISYPVPLSWKKDKSTGEIYNLAVPVERERAEAAATNLKGLQDGYFVRVGQAFSLCTPNLKVEYHHRRPQDISKGSPDKNDGEFYQFEVLEEGQEFAAQVIGKVAYLMKIQELLSPGEIWLGKSRSAQYAYCKVTASLEPIDTPLEIENGDKLYLNLLSDTIIKNENGLSVVTIEDLQKEFVSLWNRHLEPHITAEQLVPQTEETFITANRLGGFMNIWKLPKPQEPVFGAGSIIAFVYRGQDIEVSCLEQHQLGQETHRGFGRFRLLTDPETNITFTSIPDVRNNVAPQMPNELIPVLRQAIEADIKAKAIKQSLADFNTKTPTSLVRRIMAAVESGSQAQTGKAQAVLNNIEAIKCLKNKKPSWIMHLEGLLKSAAYPDFLMSLLQETAPDRNLATMETWLGINQTNKDSWFFLLEQYCRHYLRNLALQLRKDKNSASREVNNETAE